MFLLYGGSRLRTNISLKSLHCSTPRQIAGTRRGISSSSPSFSSSHTVTLDNEILYLDEKLARALGWTPEAGVDGVKLSLHGWKSHYFVITKAGTDSERLARGTIESSRNEAGMKVLEQLKDQ